MAVPLATSAAPRPHFQLSSAGLSVATALRHRHSCQESLFPPAADEATQRNEQRAPVLGGQVLPRLGNIVRQALPLNLFGDEERALLESVPHERAVADRVVRLNPLGQERSGIPPFAFGLGAWPPETTQRGQHILQVWADESLHVEPSGPPGRVEDERQDLPVAVVADRRAPFVAHEIIHRGKPCLGEDRPPARCKLDSVHGVLLVRAPIHAAGPTDRTALAGALYAKPRPRTTPTSPGDLRPQRAAPSSSFRATRCRPRFSPSFRVTRCKAERSTADRGTRSSASRSDTVFVVVARR